jgi:hypothetical protein
MDRRETSPFILNLNNRWISGLVNLISWLLNTWGKKLHYPFNRRQGMPQNPSRHFGEEKSLTPNGNWTPFWAACGPVTILTALNLTYTSASNCWYYKFPISCPFSAAYVTPVQGPVYHFTTWYISYSERLLDPFTNPNVQEHSVSCLWLLIQNIHL